MRYIVAIVIVGALVGCISLAANQMGNVLQKRMRQQLADAQAKGEIPPEVDLNSGDFTDFGREVSESELWQIGMLDAWFMYRVILIPLLFVMGLLAAHYAPSTAHRSKSPAAKTTAPST